MGTPKKLSHSQAELGARPWRGRRTTLHDSGRDWQRLWRRDPGTGGASGGETETLAGEFGGDGGRHWRGLIRGRLWWDGARFSDSLVPFERFAP